jgi:hypothetical protein
MLNKAQNSISKLLKETFSSELARIATLDEQVRFLSATVASYHNEVQSLQSDLEALKLLDGKTLANQIKQHGIYENIQDAEFRVFSQFGDDGIIQYLIHHVKPEPQVFIEFGTQNYRESNTRFLLMNNNWKGLIIEGDANCIAFVKQEPTYWRYDLTAVNRFIDRDNINQIFTEHGFIGEIGLLSIDIDGNDYWVWEAIDSVNPAMVIVEYNSVFGAEHAISIPYDPRFQRTRAHYSNLFWGASLRALYLLAQKKGYAFVGCNSNGNNAHFVRKDKVGKIPAKTIEQGYVESRFRESRDLDGNLTYLRGRQRLDAIKDKQVVDVETNRLVSLRDLLDLE